MSSAAKEAPSPPRRSSSTAAANRRVTVPASPARAPRFATRNASSHAVRLASFPRRYAVDDVELRGLRFSYCMMRPISTEEKTEREGERERESNQRERPDARTRGPSKRSAQVPYHTKTNVWHSTIFSLSLDLAVSLMLDPHSSTPRPSPVPHNRARVKPLQLLGLNRTT